MISFFFSLGANKRPLSAAFINSLGQIENIFSISALTPSVKHMWPISTFPPIGMLDLG